MFTKSGSSSNQISRKLLARVALLAILGLFLFGIYILADDWVFLGERNVTDRLDHDIIPVTTSQGKFTAIKLVARNTPINLHRVLVRFGNNTVHDVALREVLPKNGETRVIDLPGKNRMIKSVEFWYDARSITGRNGSMRLWGKR